MDEHNVHHLWGISPAVDLLAVGEAAGLTNPCVGTEGAEQPINILQAASYDARHTLTTLCRLHRHAGLTQRPIHLYVYEEEPEVLLRHVLLLMVLLDGSLMAKERMEALLELHSNALLRDNTAAYLEEKGRALELLLVSLSSRTATPPAAPGGATSQGKATDPLKALMSQLALSKGQSKGTDISQDKGQSKGTGSGQEPANGTSQGGGAGTAPGAEADSSQSHGACDSSQGNGAAQQHTAYDSTALLASLLDISLLKFQDRDRLVEAVQRYRTATKYDMVQAWDGRARKWYQERYDVRRNMIDWDYHMPMTQAGTPGQPQEKGCIIHYHHFRHWRLHGVAYELRDARYNQPNRSMLSTAFGRTREFKDRNGKDVGRSVSAWGFWGDLLNSPYHCWGTLCEDDQYYKFSNKQWTRTAIDIAERNVLALVHELRTGSAYIPSEGEAHRARAARGPTSLADLQEESERTQRAKEQHQQQHEGGGAASGDGEPPMDSIQEGEEGEDEAVTVTAADREDGTVSGGGGATADREGGTASGGGGAAGSDGVEGASDADVAAAAALAAAGAAGSSNGDERQGGGQAAVAGAGASASGSGGEDGGGPVFQASATFQGPRPGFMFKRGAQGVGYYPDGKSTQAAAPSTSSANGSTIPTQPVNAGQQQQQSSSSSHDAAAAAPAPQTGSEAEVNVAAEQETSISNGVAADTSPAAVAAAAAAAAAASPASPAAAAAAAARFAEEAEALRAAEETLDMAAAARLLAARVRIIPVLSGGSAAAGPGAVAGTVASDLAKLLTGRAKYKGWFHVLSLGHRHVHLVNPEHKLAQAAAPGAVLLVEGARNLLQLKAEQVAAFATKVEEMAVGGGWAPATPQVTAALRMAPESASAGMAVTDAHLLFSLKAEPAL